jgi:hypothetical protein
MTKHQFYRGKKVVEEEWWLSEPDLPGLVWARLREFENGASDVCFDEFGNLYGFADRKSATDILLEDEFVRFLNLDREDEKEYAMNLGETYHPPWIDRKEQSFEYFGER